MFTQPTLSLMAFGVDLNWPPVEGDGDGLLDLNLEPADHEEQHQVAADVHGRGSEAVFPSDLNFSEPENRKHVQTCKNYCYQYFMWTCCFMPRFIFFLNLLFYLHFYELVALLRV
jgi:hypothetical protein